MIVGVEIENFRGIRSTNGPVPLSQFQVLVGPNGSGKSTFLDAFNFVRDCLDHNIGPRRAVELRSPNPADLTYQRQGGDISIGFWLDPDAWEPERVAVSNSLVSYRVKIGFDSVAGVIVRREELKKIPAIAFASRVELRLRTDGPGQEEPLIYQRNGHDWIVPEDWSDADTETEDSPPMPSAPYRLERNPTRLVLGESLHGWDWQYPSAMAVQEALKVGIRFIQLNSLAMRKPVPVSRPADTLDADGGNLARVIGRLSRGEPAAEVVNRRPVAQRIRRPDGSLATWWVPDDYAAADAFKEWIDHLRFALPEVTGVRSARQESDNAEYFLLKFQDGFECPMWTLSDGMLRTLALTLLPFLEPCEVSYLVEEPENGVHPHNLEIIYQSLGSIPQAQVFVATHSPYLIDLAGPKPLLCFRRGAAGVEIIPGPRHPALAEPAGSLAVSSLFAARLLE